MLTSLLCLPSKFDIAVIWDGVVIVVIGAIEFVAATDAEDNEEILQPLRKCLNENEEFCTGGGIVAVTDTAIKIHCYKYSSNIISSGVQKINHFINKLIHQIIF